VEPGSTEDVSVDVWPLLPGAPVAAPVDADAEADPEADAACVDDECVEELLRPLLDERDVDETGTVVVEGGFGVQVDAPDGDDERPGCFGIVVVVVVLVLVGDTTVVEVVVEVVVVVGGSVVVVVGGHDALVPFDTPVVAADRAAVVVAAFDRVDPVEPWPEVDPLEVDPPVVEPVDPVVDPLDPVVELASAWPPA
jgi:hypothetical protein